MESHLIIIIVSLIIILFVVIFSFRHINIIQANSEKAINKVIKDYEDKNNYLNEQIATYEKMTQEFEETKTREMLNVLNKTEQQIYELVKKDLSMDILKNSRHELMQYEAKLQLEKNKLSQSILIDTIQSISAQTINGNAITEVHLPDDSFKGKAIGKEGRNFNLLENTLGVSIIIDDTPNYMYVSSYNPIRKEIAKRVLNNLVKLNSVNHILIEQQFEICKEEIEVIATEYGQQTFEQFDIYDTDIQLVKQIGMLYFFNSLNQNVLQHSIEVAQICRHLAKEFSVDEKIALRAGLLHDMGKFNSLDIEADHIEIGTKLAIKYKEDDLVIKAINEHHDLNKSTSIYSEIVKIADTLSAARPGARINDYNNYYERINLLEEIVKQFSGVKNVFAIRGGRNLRVIVDSEKVNDDELKALATAIKLEIYNKYEFSGVIDVSILRENIYRTQIKI